MENAHYSFELYWGWLALFMCIWGEFRKWVLVIWVIQPQPFNIIFMEEGRCCNGVLLIKGKELVSLFMIFLNYLKVQYMGTP